MILIEFIDEKVRADWDIPPQFKRIDTCWKELTEDEMRVNLESGLTTLTREELQSLVKSLIEDMDELITDFTLKIPTESQNIVFQRISLHEDNISRIVDSAITIGATFKEFREMGYDLTNQVTEKLVLLPLKSIYEKRYGNDISFFEFLIQHQPPIQREESELNEYILRRDYAMDKVREQWRVSPEYGHLWDRMSLKDIRTNLRLGLQASFDPMDLGLLISFTTGNFDIPELGKGDLDVETVIDTILEQAQYEKKKFCDLIVDTLCFIYIEKFHKDDELIAMANEKLPERDERIIPY